MPDIRDAHPPVDFLANYLWLYVLLALGLTALIFWIVKRKRSWQKQKPPAEPKEPWVIALESLEALKKKNWPAQGKVKEYYSALSDIIRRYIEAQFAISAPEMTTEEFLSSLNRSHGMSDSQKAAIKEFLNSCDMVKFAKYGPQPEEMEESFNLARQFVEETKGTFNVLTADSHRHGI